MKFAFVLVAGLLVFTTSFPRSAQADEFNEYFFTLGEEILSELKVEVKSCGKDSKKFLEKMVEAAAETKRTYVASVSQMHPHVRNVVDYKCDKPGSDMVTTRLCFRNALTTLREDADVYLAARKSKEKVPALVAELAKNDNFLLVLLTEGCGKQISTACFDGTLVAFQNQLRESETDMILSFYHIARWGIFARECEKRVGTGKCLKSQKWDYAAFTRKADKISYIGFPAVVEKPAPKKQPKDEKKKEPKKDPKKDPKKKDPKADEKKADEKKADEKSPDPVGPGPKLSGDGSDDKLPGHKDGTEDGKTTDGDGKAPGDPKKDEPKKDEPKESDKPPSDEQKKDGEKGEKNQDGQKEPPVDPTVPPADENEVPTEDGFLMPPGTQRKAKEGAQPLDCSPPTIEQMELVVRTNPDASQRSMAKAVLFACHIQKSIQDNPGTPTAVKMSLGVLAQYVLDMMALGEGASLGTMKGMFDQMISDLHNLKKVPGIPGDAELANLIKFLEAARDSNNPIALYNMARKRNKRGSEIGNALCPWKNAVDQALPGSTSKLPSEVLICW